MLILTFYLLVVHTATAFVPATLLTRATHHKEAMRMKSEDYETYNSPIIHSSPLLRFRDLLRALEPNTIAAVASTAVLLLPSTKDTARAAVASNVYTSNFQKNYGNFPLKSDEIVAGVITKETIGFPYL